MKIAVFSAKPYDKTFLNEALKANNASASHVKLVYYEHLLNPETASLVKGAEAVCVFVNDILTEEVLEVLWGKGVRAVLLRCAGYNNVDLDAAERIGFFVANVPSYSPEAVAEFAVALIQTLNRKTHRAFNRVREGNFNLNGLLGRTLAGKTVGIVGTGKIGVCLAHIMRGFKCKLIAYDPFPNPAFKEYGEYMSLEELLPQCDIVSLHCPLMEKTRHIINAKTLALMKPDAMLVNTSRGGLVDTKSVVQALKDGKLGGMALDVYEAEGKLFYNDHSGEIINDDDLARLMSFPNVLICGHQGFFTEEALREISECTFRNLEDFTMERHCPNSLVSEGNTLVRVDSHPVRNV
jgi:D-lactate dehydrogenase